jgi:hypothetical protein
MMPAAAALAINQAQLCNQCSKIAIKARGAVFVKIN